MNKHLATETTTTTTTTIIMIMIALVTTTITALLISQLMPQLSFGTVAVQGPSAKSQLLYPVKISILHGSPIRLVVMK